MALLEVNNLDVRFALRQGDVRALRDVSFTLDRGERLGIVGESGAGKSVAAFTLLNLIAKPGYIAGGSIRFDGQELIGLSDRALRRIRAAILFIESYRELPLLAWPREILDRVVALEQALLIFRQRHARMVERMIGRRVGTGGSEGVRYLDETALAYRIFPAVWETRTLLLRRDAVPPLRHPEKYQFRASGA